MIIDEYRLENSNQASLIIFISWNRSHIIVTRNNYSKKPSIAIDFILNTVENECILNSSKVYKTDFLVLECND
jgi:hypothetical protein